MHKSMKVYRATAQQQRSQVSLPAKKIKNLQRFTYVIGERYHRNIYELEARVLFKDTRF